MKKNSFSGAYVMKVTFHHMIRAVDISLRKTIARLDEFDDDGNEGEEVLKTLSNLSRMREDLVKIMDNNPELFQRSIDE